LFAPYLICIIGFVAQVVAPGHKVRGGTGFGFSLKNIILTILHSLRDELVAPFKYIERAPLIVAAFICIIVFGWLGMFKAINSGRVRITFRYPLAYFIFIFLINSALNAPYIYSVEFIGVSNSTSGPMVVEWLVFFLSWSTVILYFEGWLITKLVAHSDTKQSKLFEILTDTEKYRRFILFPALTLCFLMLIHFRGNVKDSFAYQAYEYVQSGQAADYKMQIAEYMEILLDDSIEEAYLKPINNKQGPLTHWTVTDDEMNYVNGVYKDFYRKKIVVVKEN
jgi:hypothetical protein